MGKKYQVAIVITHDTPPGPLPFRFGSHVALWMEDNGDPNDATGPILYDPAGSYLSAIRGSGDMLTNDLADLGSYKRYHANEGSAIKILYFYLSSDDTKAIYDRIVDQPGAAPFYCAQFVSSVISGIGPFKHIGIYSLPGSLARAAEKALLETPD